ncbi:MAG TPA: NUDIX hydrolase [bacterium]|nr:NUDIX hydrolase [bacterium]
MKRTLFEGRFLRLLDHDSWEFVERKNCTGIVIVIAVTEKKKVILIEQLRVPAGKKVIEFPAGLVNDRPNAKRETLKSAAFREFLEETGYRAKKMTELMSGPMNSGISSARVTFFRAEGLKKMHEGGGDPTESIMIHEVPLKKVDSWLKEIQKKGKAVDPKVYAGLYFLMRFFV